MNMPIKYRLQIAVNAWNEATCPYKPRTDHEHHRQRQRANAAMRIIQKHKNQIQEFSNGMLWLRGI